MPPKRRAAPTTSPQINKRARISDAADVIGKQRSEESHISGRPKRSGPEPIYNFTRPKSASSKLTKLSAPSQRQSQSGPVEAESVKRGRGRPRTSEPVSKPEPARRGRGRPRTSGSVVEAEPVKRGRGRPRTSESTEEPERANGRRERPKVSQSVAKVVSPASKSSPRKNSSGRRYKALSRRLTRVKRHIAPSPLKQQTARTASGINNRKAYIPFKPTGKRGRPPKNVVREDTDIGKETSDVEVETKAAKPTKRGRKPNKSVATTKITTGSAQDDVNTDMNDIDGDESEEDPENDRQYWLMKAEPETRYENGVDISYSIDDLLNATEPEGWEGIRNLAARNNMRAMKLGDLAFFYHSNCKTPGIVGVMSIAHEHSTDESAFDPTHPYYDPKSTRENPKWDLVHVQFERKFKDMITLKELQKYAKPGGALEGLQTLRQTRLSVSKVTPEQWKFILNLVDEDDDVNETDGANGAVQSESKEDAGDKNKKLAAEPSRDELVDGLLENANAADLNHEPVQESGAEPIEHENTLASEG